VNWPGLPADELIRACATAASRKAWEEFIERYHGVITSAAVRVSRRWGDGSSEEIDDVVQEIYLKLYTDRARIFAEFQASHPDAAFGFIKVVATNAARDFFRSKTAGKRGAAVTDALAESSQHVQGPAGLERSVSVGELYRLVDKHTQYANGSRDRAIFHLYYRDGMTAQAISTLPGLDLNVKGVEAVLHRLTKVIRDAVADVDPQQESGSDYRFTGRKTWNLNTTKQEEGPR
jgi:RNA polymerase sigma-70 factor (ECF subfamily)